MRGSKEDPVFMYGVLGSWAFSPHPQGWLIYQDWFHAARENGSGKPYVPGLILANWYKGFERAGKASGMWTMWHIYYCYINHLYTVYRNLK